MLIGGASAAVAGKGKYQETSFRPTQLAKSRWLQLVWSVPGNCKSRGSAPRTIVKSDKDETMQSVNAKR
tara:strand:- start:487 stop:693 length:207 start_codon:yes stop_codon:yes gene_type:complete